MKTTLRLALIGLFGSALLCGCGLSGDQEGAALSSLETSRMGPPAITGPTLQQYLSYQKGAQQVAQGKMTLDGHPVSCGARPTVIDANLDSWGGSFPGYLILNPNRLRGLSTPVKQYVYYHECGHQFVGASETGADCFSIRRGVKSGWLNAAGMNQICDFISELKGDAAHPPGPQRCQLMRQCYAMTLHDKAQAHN